MASHNTHGRDPPRWIKAFYKLLAAGRLAASWLPELIILYEIIREEEGEEKARNWLIEEISRSIKPSMAHKFYLIVYAFHRAWKLWQSTSSL